MVLNEPNKTLNFFKPSLGLKKFRVQIATTKINQFRVSIGSLDRSFGRYT